MTLLKNEITTLRRLRHPLLVWQQRHEEGAEVVPIDVIVKPETKVVAITGAEYWRENRYPKDNGIGCADGKSRNVCSRQRACRTALV